MQREDQQLFPKTPTLPKYTQKSQEPKPRFTQSHAHTGKKKRKQNGSLPKNTSSLSPSRCEGYCLLPARGRRNTLLKLRGRCVGSAALARVAAACATASILKQLLVTLDAVLRDDNDTVLLGLLLGRSPGEVVTADLLRFFVSACCLTIEVKGVEIVLPRRSRRRTRRAGRRPCRGAQPQRRRGGADRG